MKYLKLLFSLIVISLLLNLGFRQLNRSAEKTLLQAMYLKRHHETVDINSPNDLRYYCTTLYGTFANDHNILLDNKIVNHQIGYELYTPFYIFGSNKIILVDRGFIPRGVTRDSLPNIEPIFGEVTIHGILNTPPSPGLPLEKSEHTNWPWRVSNIDLAEISKTLNSPFYNYVLLQNINETPSVGMSAEKHKAYALQWFMLAGIFIIAFILFNFRRN